MALKGEQMSDQGISAFGAAALLVFFVFLPVISHIVRRQWRLMEIRRAEVLRLLRMAAEELERAELEAATSSYAVGKAFYSTERGGSGMLNCAVCSNPTKTRCARCKTARYCSGTCQISHWRQGHKYECYPPLINGHFNGQVNSSDANGALDEQPNIDGNGFGIDGKVQITDDGSFKDKSASNKPAAQPETSVVVDSKLDIEGKALETASAIHSEVNVDDENSFTTEAMKMHGNASSKEDVTSLSSGKEFLPDNNSSDRHEDLVINADQGNFQTFPRATMITESLSSSSFSSCLNPDPEHASDETEIKLHAPSNMNSSSADKSKDARISEKTTEFTPLGLNFSTGSSIHLSNLNAKVGQVIKESNTEQLKPPRPASVVSRQSFLLSGFLKPESVRPLNGNSVKFGSSLANGKTYVKRAPLLSSSESFPRRSQSGVGNEHGKGISKVLSTYDNFIRLCNSDKVGMRPCGLINCGNSCYANAVLQCLIFTRPLSAFLFEGFHAGACLKKGWCFICDLETLLLKAKKGMSPVHPKGIISHIRDIGSNFVNGSEEDAHEFLRYSIDAMQSACLKESGAGIVSHLAEETTFIQLIFGGYLLSKIKCMRCQGKSERRERMMDLTIDIYGDIKTLEECLARYTASEILEGENKYKCGKCNSFERAKKRLTIMEAPNVLTIALKRYQSGKYGKLNGMVRFPEYLNLAPYMRGSDDNSPVYRLYAVVVHSGHLNATFSGHYVSYVKNSQGKWFKANDSEVNEVDLDDVLSQNAYLLLYARCSPRAPNFIRKEMAKTCKLKEPADAHDTIRGNDLLDERFGMPPKGDSSSDASSLFSCSDEGSSWSTDSTKGSSTSDDFADCSFADSGTTNSPPRLSPDSGGTAWRVSYSTSSGHKVDSGGRSTGKDGSQGRKCLHFLRSIKHFRDLTEHQRSGRGNTDWANCSGEAKSGVFMRSRGRDRTPGVFN